MHNYDLSQLSVLVHVQRLALYGLWCMRVLLGLHMASFPGFTCVLVLRLSDRSEYEHAGKEARFIYYTGF